MEILAKKIQNHDKFITQNLQTHTQWVIEETLKLIDCNSLKKVAKVSGWSENKIKDLLFFCAYFHDVGKATYEFQKTIESGSSSYHSLYSAAVLIDIEEFEFLEGERFINLLLVVVLSHHTLLPYRVQNIKFRFMDEAKEFFRDYKNVYKKFLKKECRYEFHFSLKDDIRVEIEAIEDDLKFINSKHTLRTLYSYISGILNLADWIASARFGKTTPIVFFNHMPTKENFFKNLPFSKENLRGFQKELAVCEKSVLVEIPTGEGKTEGSLLWAINNLFNENSKIIYTLPTQTTSNKLYERVQNFFDKNACGLIHSAAKIYLEKAYEKENGEVDELFRSDFLVSKSFNKPVTVSTIDSLLKYFINIGRFNIATKNFLNSVLIIDEVHSYDFKLMGFLKRFLEICKEFEVPVSLMSASIPNRIKELLGVESYPIITQKELFAKKANEIFKKEIFLEDDLDLITKRFKDGKNVLVIRNTISNATDTFKELKKKGIGNIMLYHSTFKKMDKRKKEELIFEKLYERKPFVLVATQIVEISLDIDFDVMFSDIAPIDAMIQRFGRVNRKKNPNKKGEIYIYKVKTYKPYREFILDLSYETIENGYFELGKYVEWLNSVYDRLFEEDITVKNELTRLFDEAYEKYDKTLVKLDAIKQSHDNYDLRDIELQKGDYLLYDDYIQDNIGYDYTISLPVWMEKIYKHTVPSDKENTIYYSVLKIDYSFESGILLFTEDKEHNHNDFGFL